MLTEEIVTTGNFVGSFICLFIFGVLLIILESVFFIQCFDTCESEYVCAREVFCVAKLGTIFLAHVHRLTTSMTHFAAVTLVVC